MTIFHVLKYPVSTPPTTEELMGIPEDIIRRWINIPEFLKSGMFAQNIISAPIDRVCWRISGSFSYEFGKGMRYIQNTTYDELTKEKIRVLIQLLQKQLLEYEDVTV